MLRAVRCGEAEHDGEGDGDGELRGEVPKKQLSSASRVSGSRVSTGPRSRWLYASSAAMPSWMASSRQKLGCADIRS